MKAKSYGRLAGGGSSILVIFLMLILTTLGALATASTNANLRLAKKGAAWTKKFYLLEAGGESLVELISAILSDTYHSSALEQNPVDTRALERILSKSLGENGGILAHETYLLGYEMNSSEDSVILSARIAHNQQPETQYLLAEFELIAPCGESGPASFKVLQWRQCQEAPEYEPEYNLFQ